LVLLGTTGAMPFLDHYQQTTMMSLKITRRKMTICNTETELEATLQEEGQSISIPLLAF